MGNLFYCRQIDLNLFVENAGLWNPQGLYFSAIGLRTDYEIIISPALHEVVFSLGYAIPIRSPSNTQGQSMFYFKLDLTKAFGMVR